MPRITLEISENLKRQLVALGGMQQRSIEDVARNLIERSLTVKRFHDLRRRTLDALGPDAPKTDEQLFDEIS
ncbi:MAG: hypothetical protein IT442_12300 [Phycisphaeraceae bacterium]|nr:hypothetical protein [Phycisphaeraceae bacterium]